MTSQCQTPMMEESIDFTQDIVLGLDNPFHLQGLTNDYTVSEVHGPSLV